MKRFAALLLAPALLAGCGSSQSEADGPVLSYDNAFIMAPIAGRDVTMGGIEISVKGADVTLTGVSTDIAGTVETHTMAMEDGTMKMRKVDGFELADMDLATRGPGDLGGLAQSGAAPFLLADLDRHRDLLDEARRVVQAETATAVPG